jgi:hypothetical protein
MQKWEHLAVEPRQESMNAGILTGLGDQGWELVSVLMNPGRNKDGDDWESWWFFLKRPKP